MRNYHRILDAARDVLAESGADASMEEIAARAGVGVGTVYRRFASKDALIGELLQLAVEEILACGRPGAGAHATDSGSKICCARSAGPSPIMPATPA